VAGLVRPVRQRIGGHLWKGAEAQQVILEESRFTRIDPNVDFGDSEKPPADYDRRLAKIDKAFKRNGVCVHNMAHTLRSKVVRLRRVRESIQCQQ
jgi:hypothetical protein